MYSSRETLHICLSREISHPSRYPWYQCGIFIQKNVVVWQPTGDHCRQYVFQRRPKASRYIMRLALVSGSDTGRVLHWLAEYKYAPLLLKVVGEFCVSWQTVFSSLKKSPNFFSTNERPLEIFTEHNKIAKKNLCRTLHKALDIRVTKTNRNVLSWIRATGCCYWR